MKPGRRAVLLGAAAWRLQTVPGVGHQGHAMAQAAGPPLPDVAS